MYAFFSGSDAVNFVKQYDQFGLKQSIKLTGAGFLTEPDVLPAQGKSALGVITGHFYTPLLDNPTNQRFVKEFQAKFGGKMPDGFACQGYDTAEVIVRALKAVNGNTQDKEKLVEVIEKSEFDSPRGRFRFDPKTHNVIQPFIYIREVRRWPAGSTTCRSTRSPNVTRPGHRLHAARVVPRRGEGQRGRGRRRARPCSVKHSPGGPTPPAPASPRRSRCGLAQSHPPPSPQPCLRTARRSPREPRGRMPGDLFAQALNGLAYGVLLFLLSVGLTLIFGMLDVVNLAHGSFYMLGAYAGLSPDHGDREFLARAAGGPAGGRGSSGRCRAVCLRPLYRRPPLDQVLLTFGFIYLFEDLVKWIWGGRIRSIPPPDLFSGSVIGAGRDHPVLPALRHRVRARRGGRCSGS